MSCVDGRLRLTTINTSTDDSDAVAANLRAWQGFLLTHSSEISRSDVTYHPKKADASRSLFFAKHLHTSTSGTLVVSHFAQSSRHHQRCRLHHVGQVSKKENV